MYLILFYIIVLCLCLALMCCIIPQLILLNPFKIWFILVFNSCICFGLLCGV